MLRPYNCNRSGDLHRCISVQLANPDISVTDGIAVILQPERQFFRRGLCRAGARRVLLGR